MGGRAHSAAFTFSSDVWREMRDEYEDAKLAAYEAAETALNGVLLNARGKAKHIDAYSLFMGTKSRAHAYASEELIEWWKSHPRVTFQQFERERSAGLHHG